MPRLIGRALAGFLLVVSAASAQTALTWEQVRERFRTNNPNLTAGRVGVEESKAQEITAYLRPNPDLTVTTDGTQLTPYLGVWRPFAGTQVAPGLVICMSASTSGNCGGTARKVQPPLPPPRWKTRNARCCSICAARSFPFSTPRRF